MSRAPTTTALPPPGSSQLPCGSPARWSGRPGLPTAFQPLCIPARPICPPHPTVAFTRDVVQWTHDAEVVPFGRAWFSAGAASAGSGGYADGLLDGAGGIDRTMGGSVTHRVTLGGACGIPESPPPRMRNLARPRAALLAIPSPMADRQAPPAGRRSVPVLRIGDMHASVPVPASGQGEESPDAEYPDETRGKWSDDWVKPT